MCRSNAMACRATTTGKALPRAYETRLRHYGPHGCLFQPAAALCGAATAWMNPEAPRSGAH
jgi:hypothetical protein